LFWHFAIFVLAEFHKWIPLALWTGTYERAHFLAMIDCIAFRFSPAFGHNPILQGSFFGKYQKICMNVICICMHLCRIYNYVHGNICKHVYLYVYIYVYICIYTYLCIFSYDVLGHTHQASYVTTHEWVMAICNH